MNIYTNNTLSYPLNETEYDKINSIWHFIDLFMKPIINVSKYRRYIIKAIREIYDAGTFYELECASEKIIWNLINKLKTSKCDTHIYSTEFSPNSIELVIENYYDDNAYRSCINKLILISDVNNEIYYRKMEGTADLFMDNIFNSKLCMALSDRQLYEKIMESQIAFNDLKTPEYYLCGDYAFPNLNFAKPFIQSEKFRKMKINKLFYSDENNWFILHGI